MEPDFGGYATRYNVKCADGRTILPMAFEHMDAGTKVPLVWQHMHKDGGNVLGHVLLEKRSDGVYAHGYFNDTPSGQNAKALVKHGDITALSIYANKLIEKSKLVQHGVIREVSLVLSGANPEARIDRVTIAHADGDVEELEDEAIIYPGSEGLDVSHSDEHEDAEGDEDLAHVSETATIQEVFDSLDDVQKDVVAYMIGVAVEQAKAAHSDESDNNEGNQGEMKHNVFDQNKTDEGDVRHELSHEDVKGIVADAIKRGSLRDAVENYAVSHGITDINLLFPDAKSLQNRPEFNKRRTEWVAALLDGANHSPFSRVKTIVADITQDEARAKGYIKGNLKKEEWFGLTKRVTSPTTVYKKQTLDRDDVVDITDFDVVAWLKAEMRVMLEEEIARAILVGDGRDVGDIDKIKDPIGAADGIGIRSILNDHELFATTVTVNVDDENSNYDEVVDGILDGFEFYKGTGSPVFYTSLKNLNMFLKAKDTTGRRLYPTKTDVAAALNVRDIVTVDVLNDYADLVGIIVNPSDYNIGTDAGGEVSMFDDFDIDYNQMKYLMETRLSGALTKIKSALVIKKTAGTNVLVNPNDPTFNKSTGVVTIPSQTGVVYKNKDTSATLTAGAQSALAAGATLNVIATPASGYYFSTNADDEWSFKRPSA